MGIRRVALVVPGLSTSGGVPAVAAFLYRVLEKSGEYEPSLFSLPMSARDNSSVRFLTPATWFRGVQVAQGVWRGWPYQHVGAVGVEVEYMRYQPRRQLTEALSEYDLVQVVAGTPAWAFPMRDLRKPVLLQVATLTCVERRALLQSVPWPRHLYLRIMNSLVSRLEDAALRNLAGVFVENRWMYEYLSRKMGPSKVILAPPGVNTAHFHPGPYQANGHILFVGRLNDPRKNVSLLLRAYRQLRTLLPSAPKLLLTGKSMLSAAAWRMAESLGVAEHIEVYYNVSDKELGDLYRKASMFVLPSDEEGLGIVILEAMASGIPVVATRCGGPETAVRDGETGFLVPTGDAEALASRMQFLLEHPKEAERMGQAGRKRAEEQFSLDVAGKAFLERYALVLTQASI